MPAEDAFEPYETAPPDTGRSTGEAPHGGRQSITVTAPKREVPASAEDAFEPYESGDIANAPATPDRAVGVPEAVTRGYVDIGTMGLAPGIAGATAAGTAPGGTGFPQTMEGVPSENPGGEAVGEGIARLWNDHFGNHPDPQARAAYQQGSRSVIENNQLAYDQHFVPYILGQLGAALSMPGTLGRAAVTSFLGRVAPALVEGTMGRIGGAALTGGLQNAAYTAGTALSEGRPEDIPEESGKGLVTGGALGFGGGVLGATASGLASKAGTIYRGKIEPEVEAGRRILSTLTGGKAAFTPEEARVAQEAGVPATIMDLGDQRTRSLARTAADTSPQAEEALRDVTEQRFLSQPSRIGGWIRRRFGSPGGSTEEADRIAAVKAAFNKPAYERAYAAGDRPIWNNPNRSLDDPRFNELEKLASTKAVQRAIAGAAERGTDRAIADDVNMGAFRPSISIDSQGGVTFNKGPTGVPTYPNIQFWDYVQRELKDQADSLYRKNKPDQGGVVTNLRQRLLKELDSQVPEFGLARQGAHTFFKAEDAMEAGKNFVMEDFDEGGAQRALAKFKPMERQLFARSFANELARRVENIPNKEDVLNRAFVYSDPARRKITMALGPDRANEIEALLRVETILNKGRAALGGSQTARNLARMAESGIAGGGAVAAYEALKGEDFSPGSIIAGAIGVHGARHGLQKIDQNVMAKVGQMLASNDVAQLQRGVQSIANSPVLMRALRAATGVTRPISGVARTGAADVGFTNVAAGATMAAEDIGDIFRHKEEGGRYPIPSHETENKQYHQYEDVTQ